MRRVPSKRSNHIVFAHRFPAQLSELRGLREAIEREARQFGFSESIAASIMLAVDEACANVIEHSYTTNERTAEDAASTLLVEVLAEESRFVVKITDSGRAYHGDRPGKLDLRRKVRSGSKGGLGLHIIHRVMDDVLYSAGTGATNTLQLIKYLH